MHFSRKRIEDTQQLKALLCAYTAWGQGQGNGFLQLAVKDVLPQYMKNDSAAGNSTKMSPKNSQENLKLFY